VTVFADLIVRLANLSFSQGVFLSKYKPAIVTTLLKKPTGTLDDQNPTNFRHLLLDRLNENFGVSGSAHSWLRSYLSNRHQSVRASQSESPRTHCPTGVPQGSVLGPLLFTCYISPISSIASSFNVSIQQYADNTQIYIALTTADVTAHVTRLSSCLSVLHNWFCVITALHLIAVNHSSFCLAPDNVFATSLWFLYLLSLAPKFPSPITLKPWVSLSMLTSHSTNTSHHSVNGCIFTPGHCAIFAVHYLTAH